MIKSAFRNFLNKIYHFFDRKIDQLKIQNAQNFFFNLELNLDKINNLDQLNYSVFSQKNEDAILQFLLKVLNIKKPKFVEIGTQNYEISNTRYIFETMRSEGLIIDKMENLENEVNKIIKFWKNELFVENVGVTTENINDILKKNNFDNNLDIFSIDIDGIDYWIIKSLKAKISKIFVAEYNPYFGPELQITVPNLKNFERTNYHYSNLCWGTSLKALINLMKEKNYTFIGSNLLRHNAFFINNDYLDKFKIQIPNEKELFKFTDATFKESRDQQGELSYVRPNDVIKSIENCEVFNIQENKIDKIKDLI